MTNNYFELFELPVQFAVDKGLLKKKFFELSKQYHPDHFAGGDSADQLRALERSADLNKGLKILSNKDETIKYVLMQKGLLQDEEKYTLPQNFLMEMLEVNEELAEAVMSDEAGEKEKIQQQLTELENEIYEPVKNIIEHYKEGVTTEEELLQVKDYYFKKKYLARLSHQLNGK